jgi:hypothetical protein
MGIITMTILYYISSHISWADLESNLLILNVAIGTVISLLLMYFSDRQQEKTSNLIIQMSDLQNKRHQEEQARKNWAYRSIIYELNSMLKKDSSPENLKPHISELRYLKERFGNVLDPSHYKSIEILLQLSSIQRPEIQKLQTEFKSEYQKNYVTGNEKNILFDDNIQKSNQIQLLEKFGIETHDDSILDNLEKSEFLDVKSWALALKANKNKTMDLKNSRELINESKKIIKKSKFSLSSKNKVSKRVINRVKYYESLILINELGTQSPSKENSKKDIKKIIRKYEKTKNMFLDTIDFFKTSNETILLEQSKNSLGALMKQHANFLLKNENTEDAKKQFENIIRLYESLIETNKKLANFKNVGMNCKNLADVYGHLSKLDKIEPLKNLDQSIEYYKNALQFYDFSGITEEHHVHAVNLYLAKINLEKAKIIQENKETLQNISDKEKINKMFKNAINESIAYANSHIQGIDNYPLSEKEKKVFYKEKEQVRSLIVLAGCYKEKDDEKLMQETIDKIIGIYDNLKESDNFWKVAHTIKNANDISKDIKTFQYRAMDMEKILENIPNN